VVGTCVYQGVTGRDVLTMTQTMIAPTRKRPAVRRFHLGGDGLWQAAALIAGAIVLLPIVSIFFIALGDSGRVWSHLASTVLASAIRETALLMLGVGVLTAVIGTGTAWLVTMYRFPGRHMLDWMLILPLAIPTYLGAYAYADVMGYSGPLQGSVRALLGVHSVRDYWFPEIRSLGGAAFVMALVLYPYVYLMARASFVQQSVCVLEVARTLGRSSAGVFYAVGLPLARPAIVVGVALALMECLNDIGAVEYFGVRTLTTLVYTTWLERSSLAGAAQLSLVILAVVVLLLWLERLARRRRYFHHTTSRYRPLPDQALSGLKAWAATCACALPVLLGFGVPFAVLARGAVLYADQLATSQFWMAAGNSLLLAASAAALCVTLVVLMVFAMRLSHGRAVTLASRLSGVGYAMPGTVIALGLLIPLATFDNQLDAFMRANFGISTGLLMSGSIAAMVLALSVRFLAVALGAVEAGFHKIPPSIDAAARALGARPGRLLFRVHLPMLSPAIGAGALLVFVDSMKELPATLLMRPFNFDTLATHVYTQASLSLFSQSAPAALMIVLIGLAPVILLHRAIAGGRPGSHKAPPSLSEQVFGAPGPNQYRADTGSTFGQGVGHSP
jgi:iron(III) transport system permease protein